MKTRKLILTTITGLIGLTGLTLFADTPSILTDTGDTEAQQTARQVLRAPAQTADVVLNQLNDGIERIFGNQNPQAILDAMGPKAAKVFALNGAFGQMVAQLLQSEGDTVRLARLQAILSRIPAHTIHEDGTVTLDPVPEPEPSPTPEP